MLAGCSEISISVIVKHVQHIGIIRAFCLPGGGGDLLSFSLHGGTKKIAGLWFAGGGISTQADTTTGSPYTVSKTKFVQLDTFHS